MIRKMLLPIIKRYKGLFASMVIVSALAVAALTGLVSIVQNTSKAYTGQNKVEKSESFIINTDLNSKSKFEALTSIEGVEEINYRITFEGSINNNESTKVLASTYSENDFLKNSIEEEKNKSEDLINIAVEKNFAKQNKIRAGKKVEMNFYEAPVNCFVKEIVNVPESQSKDKTAANIFMPDDEYTKMIKEVSKSNIELSLLDMFNSLSRNSEARFANQILVKCKSDSDSKVVMSACVESIEGKVKIYDAEVLSAKEIVSSIKISDEIFNKISIVVPAFFYFVMLVIIIIFLNQIVLCLTPNIGIMLSQGVERRSIIQLLSAFSLCVSIGASILGYIIGKVLTIICGLSFKRIYELPSISIRMNILIIVVAIVLAITVGQLAVLFALGKVFKITPKDVMINNETNKRSIPKFLAKKLKRSKTNTSLNLTLAFHSSRRIIASIFCIIVSSAILILSITFETSNMQIEKNSGDYSLNILLNIIIVFAILMSIVIITMMAQASLIEQKRLLSTMRTLGFSLEDISSMWIKQEVVFFVIGSAIGFPLGIYLGKLMNSNVFSDALSLPFVCTVWDVLIVVGFILIILALTHAFSMRTIKKWNLADNLRSRE